jgi:hypothetical protein
MKKQGRLRDLVGAEELGKMIPKARVVAAFSTVPGEVLFAVYDARRKANRRSLVYCGDDETGKGVAAAGLIRDVGFNPVDVGPLRIARYTEPFSLSSRNSRTQGTRSWRTGSSGSGSRHDAGPPGSRDWCGDSTSFRRLPPFYPLVLMTSAVRKSVTSALPQGVTLEGMGIAPLWVGKRHRHLTGHLAGEALHTGILKTTRVLLEPMGTPRNRRATSP